MLSRIQQAEKPYLRTDLPAIEVGDTVSVAVKVTEGDRERVQTFTGTVIGIRGTGTGKTFTVRRIVQGEGVERIFPIHSPTLESITVDRKGRVRRAKLYYLRQRVGKATRLREVIGGRRKPRTGLEEEMQAAAQSTTPAADATAAEAAAEAPAATEAKKPDAQPAVPPHS
jgi:large subunit ribosomal protein L19